MRCFPLSRCFVFRVVVLAAIVVYAACCPSIFAAQAPSLEQVLGYSFVSGLVAADNGDRFAWVENVRGVRNIWFALATDTTPRQLTHYTKDDGQELTGLVFSAHGAQVCRAVPFLPPLRRKSAPFLPPLRRKGRGGFRP